MPQLPHPRGTDGPGFDIRVARAPLARPVAGHPGEGRCNARTDPPSNRAQPVAIAVQLHAEVVSRVDVTYVSRDNLADR
jgi:hypothetical protein